MKNFNIEMGNDSIAVVAFNVPGRSMNTLTGEALAELSMMIEEFKADPAVKGIVLCSGKASGFCAGADLDDLADAKGSLAIPSDQPDLFRRLETIGKPTAVALEGLALGGGFELALACHYRVVGQSPKIRFGFPEVTVGLLPGAGGTQRVPRLTGVVNALPLLLEGKPFDAAKALQLGLVDELVPQGHVVEAARRWVVERGDPVARWDRKDFCLPGGPAYSPTVMQAFIMGTAALRKKTFGKYPAPENILKCVFEGIQVPIDAGLRIEKRYFLSTFASAQAQAMIRTQFLSKQALSTAGPAELHIPVPSRVAVIGAGMMGAGIAYAQALRKIETELIDVSPQAANRGKQYARDIVTTAVAKGRSTEADASALLGRIRATVDYTALAGVDLVIEAVFEDLSLKREVLRRIEQHSGVDAEIGSNTSTLPITDLGQVLGRPENFIGIHFFSPVDKMELIEIIRGARTSDRTVARAVAYARALGKTPIVVNDSRGFYTSRCVGTYLNEGLEMLVEGINPAMIENAGRMAGMPRGPLELMDDVAIDLTVKVAEQTRAALGSKYETRPFQPLLEKLVELGRTGRKASAGFYDYPSGSPKRLWRDLSKLLPATQLIGGAGASALEERLLYRQALEAARCFDEGVITDPRAADVGAVLGWGFARWTGGPLSFIDGIGAAAFAAGCDRLSALHGDRFVPPEGLRAMAQKGGSYYGSCPDSAER